MDHATPQQSFENDVELVRGAQRRDRAAFEQLAGKYRRMVLAIARENVSEREVEDLAQEALLRAWEKLPGLKDPHAFSAWLGKLTVNACRRWRSRARPSELSLAEDRVQSASLVGNPLEAMLRWEQSSALPERRCSLSPITTAVP